MGLNSGQNTTRSGEPVDPKTISSHQMNPNSKQLVVHCYNDTIILSTGTEKKMNAETLIFPSDQKIN